MGGFKCQHKAFGIYSVAESNLSNLRVTLSFEERIENNTRSFAQT